MLHRVVEGAEGRRVVLVHGFTQTLRSWDEVAAALVSRGRQVVRVDLPGHGGSSEVRLGFDEAAVAVGDAGGSAAYVGYSLGGRLCLRLALDRPDLVSALVLIGASPGLADGEERAARRQADEVLAGEIEALGTEAFLDRWLAQPLFAGLRPPAADLAARRANRADALAAALRLLGVGVQQPVWDRLAELTVPTLVLAGEDDARFAALGRRMAAAMGQAARAATVGGAGHAAHLQRPGEVVELVDGFLSEHDR